MRKRQLSIVEKWNLDVESYKYGAKMNVRSPQCISCLNRIKNDAIHCAVYEQQEKPKYVLLPSKECFDYSSYHRIEVCINNDMDERFYGGLYGSCIGDIIGVPVEFSTRQERDADPVQEMRLKLQ